MSATSFIYTGGTWATRPLPQLPSDASIDVGATDATRPTLTNEDFNALNDTNINPEHFAQPFDKLVPMPHKITNRLGLSTQPALKQPKPVRCDARPKWLDEYNCTYVQAPTPHVEKMVEALPAFRCAASVLDEAWDQTEEQRMMAEVTLLPTNEPRPSTFNPFGDIDDLDAFGPPLTVADSNGSAANFKDDEDEPSPVTPPWACIDPTVSTARSDRNRSVSLTSGAGFVPTTTNIQRPRDAKTTKKSIMKHAKELAAPLIAYLRERTRKREIRRAKTLALSINGASRTEVGYSLNTGVRL
ncbi:hypothetical protein NEOLEDRAFT_1238879 [Neolentinus lepideus HHB14362 ss-1]|uniref:Uncharacterized protein n=1 Tax=Neolentinus lepideus HHB14362 ss-1 TaxID=1314782 RepID=A0A165VC17_9AGAM|nr:hypothetical protein NEOLEDRAFT_1238879 [Neolentinus lepideus HHB14362 ss-1]